MSETPKYAVKGDSVTVQFGDVKAVNRASFLIEAGSVHVLLGRSGSGKTTLLRAIAGFEPLANGKLETGGRIVDDNTKAGWVPPEQRKIGFVFQDYALFPHLSVLENIAFGVSGTKDERHAVARKWLDRIRLPDHGARKPGQLSGGEQQRVALARALAPEPSLVLLDEPFSNLDAHLRRNVRDETIALIREQNATAIFVTHDAEEAFSVADTITVLHHGEVQQIGTPAELYLEPLTIHVARLCGPASFLDLTVVDGLATCALGEVELVRDPEGATQVMVRPEQVDVVEGEGAKVTGKRFLGAVFELDLELNSGDTIQARTPSNFKVGQPVGVRANGPLAPLTAG